MVPSSALNDVSWSSSTADGCVTRSRDDSRRDGHGRDDKDIVLESFFYVLTGHIEHFRNLTNLHLKVFIVIGQPIVSLEGIDQLKNLTELWVCECFVQDASSVNGCPELKKLHLYCNRLVSIPKMTNLNSLTSVSLASNEISLLTPCFAESLRELNLADNNITDLNHLVMCKHLEILNLAGNNVRTLWALVPLTKLTKLRYLYFVDQMYKISPVSSLVNYRSFLVYNMEQLKCLDGVPIESEERENCRNFYDRKFRYYRVLYNNYINVFFTEHRNLLAQSYKDLNNLRNAMMNATVTLHRASDTSTIGKECRKRQQKYEVTQFHWECKHLDWRPRLEKELDVKHTLLGMEMIHYGNVNFFHYGKEACSVTNSISEILQNFICPYTRRNMKLSSVEIDHVIHVVNTQHHCFDKFGGVKEILGIGVNESQFFIISDPAQVNEATQWPFTFLKDYITLKEVNTMKCTVTNSVAIADSEWLSKNGLSKNVLVMKGRLSGKRVLVLGYVISDELMGSFTRGETARMHLKSDDEPTEHCYHCSIYSSIIPENVIPAFIVEYRYLYQDNQFMTFGEEFSVPEGEAVTLRHSSLPNKFNATAWQNLTALNLSKLLISTFGPINMIETVVDLDVSYNHLTSLQEIARIFPNLTNLDARFNEITSTNMGKEMKALKVLSLKYNKLTKCILSLQWLKKYCKALDKLDMAYNPLNDLHDPSHMKYILVKYFPEIRKVDDEWLEDVRGDSMVYHFCMKDFPSVVVLHSLYEEIKSNPKVEFNGALCLQNNCLPTSHSAVNDYRELFCIYISKGHQFQSINLDMKKTNLRWLTIKHNLLSSLDFISEFSKIEELDLSHNILQSVSSVFESSRSLVKLNLSCNYLRDLDGFMEAELPILRVLNLSYNCIRKLEGLKNLKTLEEFYAAGNEIRRYDSLQFIKEWKSLKIIDLSGNAIEDEEMLRKFLIYHGSHLEYINGAPVSEEEITDANDTLSGTLNKNYLVKIYKPNQIKSLTELTVKKCGIRKTNFRDPDFQNLTSINLESNALTTLSSLSYLKQLKYLCLTNNKISSFGDIKRTFDNLESLHLNFNSITDLVPLELQRFPKLAALFLQDNQLTSLEGVKELRRLQYLVLDRNKLTNIKQDEMQLEGLKELYVEFNQIKDLGFLRNLRNLKKLFLAYNKIQDQSSIESFGSLKKLSELTVMGNPVCRLNSHYLLILTLVPKLALLDGHNVESQSDSCNT